MEALVLDGGVKSALAVVRSLGKRGIPVVVGASKRTGMALWSRYAARTFVYRDPLSNPDGFLEDVEREARACAVPPVLYAMSDTTLLLLSRNRSRLYGCAQLVLGDSESVEIAADKEKTRALAESLKIPTPPAATYAMYPVVVKPRHSASWMGGAGMRGTVQLAFSREEAERMASTVLAETGEAPLIQEWVRGGEFGYEALCHRGEVLAAVGHRRMRSLSPRGGAGVLKTTVVLDAGMESHAKKILSALAWEGVAMVEFKQDEEKGTPYLLEINPRFWGSLPLAIHAGVDFPFLYGLLAEGRIDHIRALAKNGYERRVTSRHFLGDVQHLARVFFARDKLRKRAYPSRVRALIDFLAPGRGVRHDVFDVTDPLPFVMEAVDHF